MLIHKTLLTVVGLSLLAFPSLAAQPPGAESLTSTRVRDNLYQVSGGGANTFFYVADDEVLVIDAKTSADAARQMLAEIAKITDKPIHRLVLTHSDGDHVNGLAGLPAGLTVISHAIARQDIAEANAAATVKLPLPNVTFSNDLTLFVGDTEVRLLHFGPAHTSGDVVVYFPAQKAVIAGDLVFVGRDPLIHAHKRGSSFGLVAVLKSLLELDADLFLSGHAEGVDKPAIEALVASIEKKQAQVKALVDQGKTLDEVTAALAPADQPARPTARRWPTLVETIYRELAEK